MLQLRLINLAEQETEKEQEREREGSSNKWQNVFGKLQFTAAHRCSLSAFSFSLAPHRYLHIFPLKRQLKWKCATTTTRRSKAYTIRTWIIYRASCMNVNNKRKRSLRFMIVQIFLRFAKSAAAAKLTRTYLSATCNVRGVSTYKRHTHDLPTCHTLPHRDTQRHTLKHCARDSRGKCH